MRHHKWIVSLLIAVIFTVTLTACTDEAESSSTASKATYTCPMHPQIVREETGTCPICGMDLVLFDRSGKDDTITLNESQVALANIAVAIVSDSSVQNVKTLNARLTVNPEKTLYVSSRVNGRIDVLMIRESGVQVSKGQPLYKIYSEELAALQQEFLITNAQAKEFPADLKFKEITDAAKQKLVLYGQTNAQIAELLKANKPVPYVTYYSPISGVVAELSVIEGQYVPEGGSIMKIENYSELWVEADLYAAEGSLVKVGEVVKVTVAGWDTRPTEMKIQFVNPTLNSESQILQVRGSLANLKNQLRPGMQATVLVSESQQKAGFTIPINAVIRDESGSYAWVEVGKGRFVPKMVTLGNEDGESVEITAGIAPGERVVVAGAYLLYSEYVLKKGKNPMASHNH